MARGLLWLAGGLCVAAATVVGLAVSLIMSVEDATQDW